jgi:hypothetical protein
MGNFFSSNGEFLETIPRLFSKRLIEVGGRRSAEAVNFLLTGLTAILMPNLNCVPVDHFDDHVRRRCGVESRYPDDQREATDSSGETDKAIHFLAP